jgi:phosphoesterase RecJ-like protein
LLKPEVKASLEAIHKQIEMARRVVLVGHVNADGDVIGCLHALAHRIKSKGKGVLPLLFEPVPERYRFIGLDDHVRYFDRSDASLREEILRSDLLMVLDLSVKRRLPGWSDLIDRYQGFIAIIDHHPIQDPPFGQVNAIDDKCCATGELVFELFRLDDPSFHHEEALGLFTAVVTDTGWFKYTNTRRETLVMASQLVNHGINPSEIYGYIYQNQDLRHIQLMGQLMGNVQAELDGRLLWTTLTRSMLEAINIEELESEDLLDLFRSVKGCQCVALFRETKNGEVRVNLRSKGDLKVNKIAEDFGGGGHRKAAGITFYEGSIEEVAEKMIRAITAYMADERRIDDGKG